jgi:hypothetical protein
MSKRFLGLTYVSGATNISKYMDSCGDEKVSLESEKVKYRRGSQGTRTRE